MKKAQLNISFAWLFAIIVGAVILFLAIYAVTKIIGSGQEEIGAKTSKEIGVLLNPLETGFESVKATSFTMPVDSRIYPDCNLNGAFGRQTIHISQRSFNEWTETDLEVGFSNKYIFSEYPSEGKKFYLFSKPFNFPFKVADVIIMTSSEEDYCFIDAPEEIETEIQNINQNNFYLEDCPSDSVNVCFGSGSCDVQVNTNQGFVAKNGTRVYFEGEALMYGAIFASPQVYECQLKRLMMRVSELARLYQDKAAFVSRNNCNSNLGGLSSLYASAGNFGSSVNLGSLIFIVNDLEEKNEIAQCKIW